MPTKRLAMLLAAQSVACMTTYANVDVPQPEAQRVARELTSKRTARMHADRHHAYTVDDTTPIEVREDMFTSEVDRTTFSALRHACATTKRCALEDDRTQFRAFVRTGTKPDEGKIGGWVTTGFITAGFGSLIAGNVACFSGTCPDGVKAGLVAVDIVAGGVVLVGVAVVAILSQVHWD